MNSAYGTYGHSYGAYTPVVSTPITDMLASIGYDPTPGVQYHTATATRIDPLIGIRNVTMRNPALFESRLTPPGPAAIGTAAAATGWPPPGAADMGVYVGPLGPPEQLEYDDMPKKSSVGMLVMAGVGILALAGGAYYMGGRRGRR